MNEQRTLDQKAPCDCCVQRDGEWINECSCMNVGDAQRVAVWCAEQNARKNVAGSSKPLTDALTGTAAALAAAISLLERTPAARKAAPSDTMFRMMLDDYRTALETARTVLKSPVETAAPPSNEQVGAHHCTPESIAALLADLDAIGECRESPPLRDRDHRAQAGVVACVIRHLQQVGKRLVCDKANLMAERNELRDRLTAETPSGCCEQTYENGKAEGFLEREDLREQVKGLQTQKNNLLNTVASKQAKIDALMLEFCPGEMPAEQKAEWAANQRTSVETEEVRRFAKPGTLGERLVEENQLLRDLIVRTVVAANGAGLDDDLLATIRAHVTLPAEKTPAAPQAPIARIKVFAYGQVHAQMYAPGLPPGEHDLYCEPETTAPYMHAEKSTGNSESKCPECGSPGYVAWPDLVTSQPAEKSAEHAASAATERLGGAQSASLTEPEGEPSKTVTDNCEHGIPRRFCTAAHCSCPGGTPDGPLGWNNSCALHGLEGRNAQNGKPSP